jgi:hypothetical protein
MLIFGCGYAALYYYRWISRISARIFKRLYCNRFDMSVFYADTPKRPNADTIPFFGCGYAAL